MKEIGKIICRIISIYLASRAFLLLPTLIIIISYRVMYSDTSTMDMETYAYLIPIIIFLIAALAFWTLAARISSLLVGKTDWFKGIVRLDLEKAQAVAFVIIGVATLTNAIPELTTAVLNNSMLDNTINRSLLYPFAAPVIKLVCLFVMNL